MTQSVLTLTAAAWPLALAAVVNMVVGIYFMTGGAFPHLLTSDERLAPLLPGPRPLSGRVVILIFDTWDADAWQARSRDVETPALDALEREGFVATRVVRAGAETFMAFPGMLSGRQAYNDTPAWASRSADLVRPTRGLDLELAFEGMTERVSWLSQDNLFRAVRRAGGNVGIAGHDYHPTCVLFRDSVSACDGGGFKPAAGLKSVLGQLDDVALDIVANVPGLRSRLMSVQPPLHPMPLAADYLRTRAAVRRFAANPDLDLIFVHYFVPHHLFYDADSNDFRSWGRLEGSSFMRAYEGHFELIDRAYDDVKKALEQAGLWERTAVILSSDHGLLRYGATDARLRVPFLMKPAGRLPPLRSDAELRLAGLPRLVLSTLGGGIREPRDIESALTSAWVD